MPHETPKNRRHDPFCPSGAKRSPQIVGAGKLTIGLANDDPGLLANLGDDLPDPVDFQSSAWWPGSSIHQPDIGQRHSVFRGLVYSYTHYMRERSSMSMSIYVAGKDFFPATVAFALPIR